MDGGVGEEILEFAVELGGEQFVGRDDQRRPAQLGDDAGDGERLSRAGHAEQRLVLVAAAKSLGQLANGARLVALRLEVGAQIEGHRGLDVTRDRNLSRVGHRITSNTMTISISLRLPAASARALTRLARSLDRSKTYVMRKALDAYLAEQADYQLALDRLRDTKDQVVSSSEIRKRIVR